MTAHLGYPKNQKQEQQEQQEQEQGVWPILDK
jgi:hypothetical protein